MPILGMEDHAVRGPIVKKGLGTCRSRSFIQETATGSLLFSTRIHEG